MPHKPLKRHDALQPLSREHFNGLVLARRLREAAGGDAEAGRRAMRELDAAWRNELEGHFEDEERLLAGLVPADMERRLHDEHAAIRALAMRLLRSSPAANEELTRFASMLQKHIRWEERELFPAAEDAATEEQLAFIAEHTQRVERDRPGARKHKSGVAPFRPWGPGTSDELSDEGGRP